MGITTANQVSNGLGFVVPQANQDWEFAAAAAAGATHVRFQCPWNTIEKQAAPPNNAFTSPQYAQDPTCVLGYASAKTYGLKPTIVAAFGPPFHKILTVTIPGGAPTGSTSINVQFSSGVGGDSLATLSYPYDYILKSDGTVFTGVHNYVGSFITSVKLTDATHANLELASAVTTALPADTTTAYVINEILYPSATTANATDASQIEFADYVSFLASDMASRGISGEIEIWNEPAWADDSWDARGYLYDKFPSGGTYSPNYGFAENLQYRSMPPGVSLNWGGTHKSGGNSLLFGPYQPTPMILREPSTVFMSESFHPYGNTPEQMMWTTACLQESIKNPSSPSAYQVCSLPGEKAGSNFMWAAQYNMAAKAQNPMYGLTQSITETGNIPPAPGLRAAQARFNMRQFIGYQALGITPVIFYAISDLTQPNDPNYSFVEHTSASFYAPDPAFTAMAGFMADIKQISNLPVTSYPASMLAQVVAYRGTFPLSAVHMVGSRSGATANSDMFVLWQRSYTVGCSAGAAPNAGTCDSPWTEQASPVPGSVTISIPAGCILTSMVNADSRAVIPYTKSGQLVTFVVADDPIEVILDPVQSLIATNLAVSTNPISSAFANQVVVTASLSPYFTALNGTNGELVSVFDGSTNLGTGTLASGVATLNVTSLALGIHMLTASYGGDSYFGASSGSTSIAVTTATPTLTFAAIAGQVYGAAPFTIAASSASPATISYTVLSGPATLSGNKVTLTGAGTVALGATQAASGGFSAASTQTNFAVTTATPTLTFAAIAGQVYGAAPFTIAASSASPATISYTVLSGPATLSGNKVTLTGAGTVALGATQAASGGFSAASTQTNFAVTTAQAPWIKVATEGDTVNVPAGTTVRFGSAPNWSAPVTFSAATTFTAINVFFGGDPSPNQQKEVDALGTGVGITIGALPAPPTQGQWTKVATEGDTVHVPAGTTVRFGFAPNWSRSMNFSAATAFPATNVFFGGDPFPNQRKEVDALGTGVGITTGPLSTPRTLRVTR